MRKPRRSKKHPSSLQTEKGGGEMRKLITSLSLAIVLIVFIGCASTPETKARFFLGQHINKAIKYYEKHRLGPDEDFMAKLDSFNAPLDQRGELTPYGFVFRPENPEHGNTCIVIFIVDRSDIIQGFLPLECE
jgi:hypothetical protein